MSIIFSAREIIMIEKCCGSSSDFIREILSKRKLKCPRSLQINATCSNFCHRFNADIFLLPIFCSCYPFLFRKKSWKRLFFSSVDSSSSNYHFVFSVHGGELRSFVVFISFFCCGCKTLWQNSLIFIFPLHRMKAHFSHSFFANSRCRKKYEALAE